MLYENFILNPYNQAGRDLESIKITKLVTTEQIFYNHTLYYCILS